MMPLERAAQPAFTQTLVAHWEDFVAPERRLLTLLPFLKLHLPPAEFVDVLDLAAGIGCDAVGMAEQGYVVTGNEVNSEFRSACQARAARASVEVEWCSYDWRHISSDMGGKTFDCSILLGNSFCLLVDPDERACAAREIAALLRPSGRLVIDERNFRYILANRVQILESGRFRYARRVMYCGLSVEGVPTDISLRRVRFGYRDHQGRVFGSLDMWPFRDGEVVDTFERVGLRLLSVHADLGLASTEDADFFTYVFEKPS